MVEWSGEDSTSGLAAYDVQVRVDGGAWQDWRVGVTETSGVYVGILGHTYAFRSRGHDRAGNVEGWPAVPDAETRLTARVRKTYIFGGMPVAVRLLAQGETAGMLVYLHLDHLGSPVVATDGGGDVVAEVRYYPYGGIRYQVGEMPTTLNFTGQRLDAGLGLLYYRARYYDPVLGRFVQPDTVVPEPGSPQTLNRYTYALNSPLIYNDPSGHCPLCIVAVVVLVGGAIFAGCDLADGSLDAPKYVQTSVEAIAGAVGLGSNPFEDLRVKDFPEDPEMTDWLLRTMQENAGGIAQKLAEYYRGDTWEQTAAILAWTHLVKSGGPWDFKVDLLKNGIETVSLAGKEWNYQIIANIHFGYVGMAAGFSKDTLLSSAGTAQLLSGKSRLEWFPYAFDEPADQAAILVGIYLWEKYGQYGIPLTEEMLREALEKYEQDLVWD